MTKCVFCKNCIGFRDGYYICQIADGIDWIEECIANDENQPCDAYVEDMVDGDQA